MKEREYTSELVKKRSTKYAIYVNPATRKIASEWSTKTDMRCFAKQGDFLNYIVKQYKLDEERKSLTCFTEYLFTSTRNETNIIRCNPNYQGNGPWNDWGMIRYKGRQRPAKFLAFVDRGNDGTDAIVEVADTTNAINNSVLTKSWSFPLINDQFNGCRYHRINVRQYVRPCLVFEKKTSNEVLQILPFQEWYMKF